VTTVLISPGSLSLQALSSSTVRLTWSDKSATETGFRIERSPLTDTNFAEIATVGANTTSFTDTGLSEATKYWYRVRAYNADTTSDYSNQQQVTTLYNIPAAPSGLTITSLLSNKVSLSWKRQGWRDLQRALRRGERDLDKPVGISYSGKRRWQNSIASNSSDE
jgi:fibronectin type III domain protein